MLDVAFVLVLVLVLGIWLVIEFRRFKHKIFAILLIVVILFTYFSFFLAIKGQGLDLKTFDGVRDAGKMYFLWIGNAFDNVKIVTSNVISMNWKMDGSIVSNDNITSSEFLG